MKSASGNLGGMLFTPLFIAMLGFPVAFAAGAAQAIAATVLSTGAAENIGVVVAIVAAIYLGKKIMRG